MGSEHASDLPLLADAWCDRLRARGDAPPAGISPAAMEVLQAYRWPGNVRELHNVLEFAALRAAGGVVEPGHLPTELLAGAVPAPREPAARRAGLPGNDEILGVLRDCGGNRAEAARRLGISRVTLWKRLRQLPGDGEPGPAS